MSWPKWNPNAEWPFGPFTTTSSIKLPMIYLHGPTDESGLPMWEYWEVTE